VADTRDQQRLERQARLEAALRSNLRRRKTQAKGRAVAPAEPAAESADRPERPANPGRD
jgi:hypothetical protein